MVKKIWSCYFHQASPDSLSLSPLCPLSLLPSLSFTPSHSLSLSLSSPTSLSHSLNSTAPTSSPPSLPHSDSNLSKRAPTLVLYQRVARNQNEFNVE
eukprot:760209-Hanusia_phi.AAC.1